MKNNYLKIYKIMLWTILLVFSGLLLVYIANSFYTHQQSRINEPMVSDLAWDLNNIKLRQLKVLVGKNSYKVEKELIIADVNLRINSPDDRPIILMDKIRKVEKARYYVNFKILVLPIADKQLENLKVRFGLMKCAYILMILFLVWQLKRMLSIVEKQRFFENGKISNCLGWMSVVLVSVPLVNFFFNLLLEKYLKRLSGIEDFHFQTDFNYGVWLWVAAGILCTILAGIVSYGVKIKEEQDLTI